ncbi:acyltransferase family protein [Paenibacillus chibensis]|uniref:acyltransferase family protein n=1 Tax=Paenibacillus chibensis TaxID=59846 RepID=UPI000FD8F205|nr:acyltransferase family protein [Paenibacillus chibensis]MEC0369722.1 fucose 4-O-acetylase [Paenibacillus chibensis]
MEKTLSKQGETYFLNLRFLLILTVLIGNAIEPLIRQMDSVHALYLWIFTFHMPLFVFVTGYFAKGTLAGAAGRKTLLQIGMQYIIFQSLYSLLDMTVFRVQNIHHSFFAPYLLLWFLASHIGWRLLTLAMHKFNPAAQVVLSLVLGVLVGYLRLDGAWLSFSRTFVYLPFFVIGYHFSFDTFVHFFTKQKKRIAAAASALLLAIIAMYGLHMPEGWLFGSMTYMQLGHLEWYAGFYRIALYGLQFISGAAFLAWVPFRKRHITDLGRRTLYVFLLHGFVIRLAVISGLYNYMDHPLAVLMLIAGALCLAFALAQPVVRKITHPVIEPPVTWITRLERLTWSRPL